MIAPFRFIQLSELKRLELYFLNILEEWNEQYSYIPLSFTLSRPKEKPCLERYQSLIINNEPVALLDKSYLKVVNQALFSKDHSNFIDTSKELSASLFHAFFNSSPCDSGTLNSLPEWFYKGSTCLYLTVNCKAEHFTLILSPHWVYSQLKPHQKEERLAPIDDVLKEQKVAFTVAFKPLRLPLQQLLLLKPHDVLVTDHALTAPLIIQHKKEQVATGVLGHVANHKSIILEASP